MRHHVRDTLAALATQHIAQRFALHLQLVVLDHRLRLLEVFLQLLRQCWQDHLLFVLVAPCRHLAVQLRVIAPADLLHVVQVCLEGGALLGGHERAFKLIDGLVVHTLVHPHVALVVRHPLFDEFTHLGADRFQGVLLAIGNLYFHLVMLDTDCYH